MHIQYSYLYVYVSMPHMLKKCIQKCAKIVKYSICKKKSKVKNWKPEVKQLQQIIDKTMLKAKKLKLIILKLS